MKKRTMKRILVATLATTLVLGSSITALADSADGTGSYEGGEMKYPTLSVTLPTIPEGTYDYIADPNGLIEATAAARYEGATFTGDGGIFFKTEDDKYTDTSAALSVTNENAQAIDVTVKLEQKKAGDEGIAYADAATFEEDDTAQKLFLAVVDDAETPNKAALAADKAATLTTTLEGVPGNYEPSWSQANGYGYTLKDEADLTDWNECAFALTGALNTNATWGDKVTFPEIKVTWSYAEHTDITTADGGVTPYNGVFYVGSSTEAGFALGDDTITSVKVNGKTLTSEQYQLADDVNNADKKWVGVPGATIEEIEEDNGWAEGSTYEFEVIYGNNKYVATYTL